MTDLLNDDQLMDQIRRAYPVVPVLAVEDFVAGLTRDTLLDVEVTSDAELLAYAAALVDADDPSFLAVAEDARRVYESVKQVRLYAAMSTMLAAPAVPAAENGDMLAGCPLWPVGGCGDLSGLSAALYQEPAQ